MPVDRSDRPRAAMVAAGLVLSLLTAALAPVPAMAGTSAVASSATAPLLQPATGDELTFPEPWQQAWQHATGAGIIVAVVDSGVDSDHPSLAGRVLAGRDFVDGTGDARTDPVGHGTAVASLIAGASQSPTPGLAPDVTILPVRVLDERNRYEDARTVADGVVWAVDRGAQVINLSLGGERASASLGAAVAYAMANDVVVIACAGNGTPDAQTRVWYPAREPGVVAVAGIHGDQTPPRHWPRSLTGREVVLAAPAVLTAASPDGGARQVQGTSFAAALVSATAALIRAYWPDASAGEVVNRLVVTATDLGEPGRDERFGFGIVDPVRALTATVSPTRVNPLDTKTRHGHAALGVAPQPQAAATYAAPTHGVAGEYAGGANPPGVAGLLGRWVGVMIAIVGLLLAAVAAGALGRSGRRPRVGATAPPPH